MKKEEITIGMKVLYHPVITDDGEKIGTIESIVESNPWKVANNQWICNVKGVRGGVHIDHIEPII